MGNRTGFAAHIYYHGKDRPTTSGIYSSSLLLRLHAGTDCWNNNLMENCLYKVLAAKYDTDVLPYKCRGCLEECVDFIAWRPDGVDTFK